MTLTTCPKCFGRKTLDAFMHIEQGKCYRCAGNGTIKVSPPSDRKAVTVGADGARYKRLSKEQGEALLAAGRFPPRIYCELTLKVDQSGYELFVDLSEESQMDPGGLESITGGIIWFAGKPGAWKVTAVSDSLRHNFSKRSAAAFIDSICRA